MRIADYDFFLPEDLIASRPVDERDASRLLVLHHDSSIEHRLFRDIPSFISPGDMLLMNNSKVLPVRLACVRPDGKPVDLLLVREGEPNIWDIMMKGSYTGPVCIHDRYEALIEQGKIIRFDYQGNFRDVLRTIGSMPLPPYISRQPDEGDRERYQTVYAEQEGSIAAPTAGLHFTNRLIRKLKEQSVLVRFLTLHVGVGTFRPVKAEMAEDHSMAEEYFEIDHSLIEEIYEAKKYGRKVIAVGTTTTRAIEGLMSGRCSLVTSNGTMRGSTDIFIYEGYQFRAVDSLITNFHLPGSTPLLLTGALAGRKRLLDTYQCAVASGYRFFSYGDAMLVL